MNGKNFKTPARGSWIKKILLLIFFLVSFFSSLLHIQASQIIPFSDLPESTLYKSYIQAFQSQNVIVGDTAGGQPIGLLRPYDPVQRAEFSKVAVLMRLLEEAQKNGTGTRYQGLDLDEFTLEMAKLLKPYYKPINGSKSFTDVKQKDDSCASDPQGCQPWYTEYINFASSHGMIKGYPDGSFKPGNSILRIHSLKLILAENGNIPAQQDTKFQRLSSESRIQKVHKPKCLEGAEGYILNNNGGDTSDTQNLLSYAILADKLDFFGSNCEFFSQNGANSPQARADLLQKPITRQEIARYFSLTTSFPTLKADHSSDPTTSTAEENGMNYYDPNYAPDLRVPNNPESNSSDQGVVYGPIQQTEESNGQKYDLEGKTGRCCTGFSLDDCQTIQLTDLSKIDTDAATYIEAQVWVPVTYNGQVCQMPYGDLSDGFGHSNESGGLFSQTSLNNLKDFAKDYEATFSEEYFAYTGIVKIEDDIYSVTNRLNKYYGTSYSAEDIAQVNGFDINEDIHTVGPVLIGTLDGWQPPEDESVIDKGYWFDLTEEQQKILHYHRNAYQMDIPNHTSEMIPGEWKMIDDEAIAHNIGTSGNSDWRGEGWREGQQAIYDADGYLVTTPENMGTFDFEAPGFGDYMEHADLDVELWIELGNNPLDSSSKDERICGLSHSVGGMGALLYLGYSFKHCD